MRRDPRAWRRPPAHAPVSESAGDREADLERALRYPYEAPRTSYVLAGGSEFELVRPARVAPTATGLDLTGAYVASSRSRLVVRTPQQVAFTVGGVARSVTTTEATVGDLLATVEVQVPAVLDQATREAVEAYRAATGGQKLRAGLFEGGA